jgi:hypothetical protein
MRDITRDSLLRISGGFRSESERSAAILAAALLDDQIKSLLEKFLVPDKDQTKMFNTYAPLSTFSGKVEMAYLLGLIPQDIRDDLVIVRKIRNLFAHRVEDVAFDKPPVSDLARNLKTIEWFLGHMYLADKSPSRSELEEVAKSPRRRFELAVALVSFAIDSYVAATEPLQAKGKEYRWLTEILKEAT